MKLIIAGGRDINLKPTEIGLLVSVYVRPRPTEVVCGMAKGIDSAGLYWAKYHDIPVKEFPADWKKHGKAAGPIRNGQMADYADALLLIWDGKSRGSANMLKQAKERGLTIYEHFEQRPERFDSI